MWGALFSQLSGMLHEHRPCLDGGAARDFVNSDIDGTKPGGCVIGETWPIWVGGYARANAGVLQGRGKVDPRMDSLALSNVPTWHFNLRIT